MMETILLIIVVIVIIILINSQSKSGKSGKPGKSVKSGKSGKKSSGILPPKSVKLEYEDSEKHTPHYLFYSIASEYFRGFNNVTKENADGYPDFYQLSYSLFDKHRKFIDLKVLNVETDYVPSGVKEKMKPIFDFSQVSEMPMKEVLETFAADCKDANVFVTHAEFHHRDILYANFYKEGMDLPFPKAKTIDIMEKARSWVGLESDRGRGYKAPSFTECMGMALVKAPYAVSKRQVGSEEKAFTLPKIYFEWTDNK